MTSLPSISFLIRRTRALAALDLILSPEWEDRYYSFNASWSPGEMMASMRNGSGDSWHLLFGSSGWAGLKGLDHESEAWASGRAFLAKTLQEAIPRELDSFASEPAFSWEYTSFAWYCLAEGSPWVRAGDALPYTAAQTGEELLLSLLPGGPEDFLEYADWYYETSLPLETVAAIYALQPVTAEMVAALNPEIILEDIADELHSQIGYPR